MNFSVVGYGLVWFMGKCDQRNSGVKIVEPVLGRLNDEATLSIR